MKTKKLVAYSMLIALTIIMTLIIDIPIPRGHGYLNLGDMVVFFTALSFGPLGGFLVGGLGSGIADLLLGYTIYAPITFLVKGFSAFIVGSLIKTKLEKFPLIPSLIGGLFMAFGYYIGEIFLYGPIPALAALPFNILQGLVGAIASVILYRAMKKVWKYN